MNTYNNRPMSYDSSKILLQYLEANTRFQLSRRVPSIRKREKLVPLKIHMLEFYPYEFLVNKTKYKLETYRDYPSGVEILRVHENDTLTRGVSWDSDQYGLTQEDRLEKQLKIFKWIQAKRSGQQVDPLDENLQSEFPVDQFEKLPDEFIPKQISYLETTLDPFRRRVQPPSTTSIQLTVISPDGTSQIWHKPSVQGTNSTLHEAQEQLADFLFGNRTDIVCVKNFEVGSYYLHGRTTVQLPSNFQIKIESLTLGNNAPVICNAIREIVHESSYPLRKIQCLSRDSRLVHPTIAGARELFLPRYHFNGIRKLISLRNHNIYLGLNCFTPEEHLTLLRNWIDNRREIGASFISQIKQEATILDIFAQAKEFLNGFEDGERCVKIPMNELSQIEVSYKHLSERANRFAEWKLIIKVVDV